MSDLPNPPNPLNPPNPQVPVANPPAQATPEPLTYAFSTGNAFSAFAKFNGKNFFTWRRNMETQLRVLGQWEVIDGTAHVPVPVIPHQPTTIETCKANAWRLRAVQAYAEIALRLKEDYGEAIATTTNPRTAWTILETSYGAQQSGIQSLINVELTLTKWNGQTPITTHQDHMKTLCTCLASAGLAITPMQFYNHFINSLPAKYNMVVTIHDPIPLNYSIDTLCE